MLNNNNNNNNILETKVVLPLKYMSNFLRSLVYHLLTMKQNLTCHGQKNVYYPKIQKHLRCLVIQMLIHLCHPWQQYEQLVKHVK